MVSGDLYQTIAATPGRRRGAAELWSLPARRTGFTGRTTLLADLDTAMHEQGRVVVAAAVTGMGGIGKTSAAIEYAHLHADEFDIAWWIPSEDPALVPERLAELARALDLAVATDPAGIAVARLRAALLRRGRWLLIFDNAEDPAALHELLPTGPGRVLVTSRNPDWRTHATTLGVDVFDRAESISLLQSRAPALTNTDADRIADAVGDLPLAVDQAGALLADTTLSVDDYLHLLADRADTVYEQPGTGTYPRTITAAFTLGFDQLAADDPAALDLLNLLAWFGPEPVPLDLLTSHPDQLRTLRRTHATDTGHDVADANENEDAAGNRLAATVSDPLALAARTGLLRRRAMIAVTTDSLHLHRVPAALLRSRIRNGHETTDWSALAARLLRAALPPNAWNNPSVWPTWQRLLAHILAVTDPARVPAPHPADSSWLLDLTASYLHTRGEPRRARPLFERALASRRYHLGDDDPITLMSAGNLAACLHALSENQQARALNQDTLDRRRRIFGYDHFETLTSASNLAMILRALGEYQQARALNEDTLARQRRTRGEDHPDALSSASHLAADLYALGQHQLARTLTQDALDRRRQTLGDDHPSILSMASNLAAILNALGEHEQARALNQDTLDRRRRILGDDHPDTLNSAHNLAANLHELGEHHQARTLDEDTLDRRRLLLGDNHSDTLNSASDLTVVLRALGENEQAERWSSWVADRRR